MRNRDHEENKLSRAARKEESDRKKTAPKKGWTCREEKRTEASRLKAGNSLNVPPQKDGQPTGFCPEQPPTLPKIIRQNPAA